jgi:hypothetical protein
MDERHAAIKQHATNTAIEWIYPLRAFQKKRNYPPPFAAAFALNGILHIWYSTSGANLVAVYSKYCIASQRTGLPTVCSAELRPANADPIGYLVTGQTALKSMSA